MRYTNKLNYSVKGIKSFRGMEGYGFNATLYRDGKKVCFVIDEATGGNYLYEWVDRKEETILRDYCKSLPKEHYPEHDITIDVDADMFVNELVIEFENYTQFKRKCKTATLFTLKTDEDGKYWSFKRTYCPDMKRFLQTKYGDQIKEIINERYVHA